jgi:hypothetical protein
VESSQDVMQGLFFGNKGGVIEQFLDRGGDGLSNKSHEVSAPKSNFIFYPSPFKNEALKLHFKPCAEGFCVYGVERGV